MQVKTLYEQKPERWDSIIQGGYPLVGQVAKKFFRACDMDRALGYTNAAAAWHRGKCNPTALAEHKAKEYLSKGQPDQAADDDVSIMMVACPANKAEKVFKVLAMMNCEVLETA